MLIYYSKKYILVRKRNELSVCFSANHNVLLVVTFCRKKRANTNAINVVIKGVSSSWSLVGLVKEEAINLGKIISTTIDECLAFFSSSLFDKKLENNEIVLENFSFFTRH